MTETIIYNGVDVSKCIDISNDRADDGYTAVCRSNNGSCKDNPNCYYKLWQRAEQKLAKIKEYCKPKVMMNGTANVILQIIEGKENE